MTGRYEIRDNDHPDWRGMRFSTLDRAMAEFHQCVGSIGRWSLIDRLTEHVLATR